MFYFNSFILFFPDSWSQTFVKICTFVVLTHLQISTSMFLNYDKNGASE